MAELHEEKIIYTEDPYTVRLRYEGRSLSVCLYNNNLMIRQKIGITDKDTVDHYDWLYQKFISTESEVSSGVDAIWDEY